MLTEAKPSHKAVPETYFASPERIGSRELSEQIHRCLEDPCMQVVLQAVDGYLVLLNQHRQILAANQELLDALRAQTPEGIIGLRPGEAFNCVHFTQGPNGCGTSQHCGTCGAVLSILAAQKEHRTATAECALSMYREGKLQSKDFRVRCTPLFLGGFPVLALVLNDISSLKRREILEETFLHDMLNSVGGIEGWISQMGTLDPQTAASEILSLATHLKEEILSQRTLFEAEKGILKVNKTLCSASAVLSYLREMFEVHPVAKAKHFATKPLDQDDWFHSDGTLLLRILINMVKNAFEAVPDGATVSVWFERNNQRPCFVVQNSGTIAPEVRPRIFERSFSTKAKRGRGIGTYGMKLLGENYLGGKVSFTTNPTEGTSFLITLPREAMNISHRSSGEEDKDRTVKMPSGKKSILFVDDEEALLRLGTLFLEKLGFTVTACSSGEQALNEFRKSPESFHLCLTDFSMPGMDGIELARKLYEEKPEMPVVLSTGFGQEGMTSSEVPKSCTILHKPFTLPELKAALEGALTQQ